MLPPRNRCSEFFEERSQFEQEVAMFIAHCWEVHPEEDSLDPEQEQEVVVDSSVLLIGRTESIVCHEGGRRCEYPVLANRDFSKYCLRTWEENGPEGDVPVGFVVIDWPYVVVRSVYETSHEGWWKLDLSEVLGGYCQLQMSKMGKKWGSGRKWAKMSAWLADSLEVENALDDAFDTKAFVGFLSKLRYGKTNDVW